MASLPILKSGLLQHRLDDQLLMYDANGEQIHLLNGPTATVAEGLGDGAEVDAIVAKLEKGEGTDRGAELLALALDELAKARLIEGGDNTFVRQPEVTRRQMLQKFAGIGAAILIPAIVTLTPTPAFALGSFINGTGCTANNQCASGCCSSATPNVCRSGGGTSCL